MFRFYADSMLGKLSRFLRFLGYDTLYRREETVEEMLVISKNDSRIILSSSQSVHSLCKKQNIESIFLSSIEISDQLKVIKSNLNLEYQVPVNPDLMRCSVCNGSLKSKTKIEILSRIPEGTAKHYDNFWECESCSKIFWLGSHWEDIKRIISKLDK